MTHAPAVVARNLKNAVCINSTEIARQVLVFPLLLLLQTVNLLPEEIPVAISLLSDWRVAQ